uniref:Nucleolar complex associated 4 homolog n=1 Tax=Callorhinchus milii TaxID=7868 RepID=A0A4W3J6X4_CALMI
MAAPSKLQRRLHALSASVLHNCHNCNSVLDILWPLRAEKEEAVLAAAGTCHGLFCTLLERGALFVGQLPDEETALTAPFSAEEKYKIWMRHRYNDCINQLLDLMEHQSHEVQKAALCTLMKFVQMEGKVPLIKYDDDHYTFPHQLLKSIVERLLLAQEVSSIMAPFLEYLEYDDVRYYVMTSATEHVARIGHKSEEALVPVYQQNAFALLSSIHMPNEESELKNFLVKQESEYNDWTVNEHKRSFERLWLGFLKQKLPTNLCKKVLVILHESILPHMSSPALMIDFLTAAYEIGGAISLLALNGLFYLIHHHNLEYPNFYKKLYSLLNPCVFHVKYRARFFHLAGLFLSSSHLPVYLVAAFAKRLSRLALTAPPHTLLMIISFICNLIRQHPACRVLINRPDGPTELCDDPFIMEEEPSQCRALESSLWELQTLQKHYHPDVANAANAITKPLSHQEQDLSSLLELTASELFHKETKKKTKRGPLEYKPAEGILRQRDDVVAQYWALE